MSSKIIKTILIVTLISSINKALQSAPPPAPPPASSCTSHNPKNYVNTHTMDILLLVIVQYLFVESWGQLLVNEDALTIVAYRQQIDVVIDTDDEIAVVTETGVNTRLRCVRRSEIPHV